MARTPLVVAVPHGGRHYPDDLLAERAVPIELLERLEDRHADALVVDAVAGGAVAIVARIARAWIDLNRAPTDIDPASRDLLETGPPPSARVRSGLGLVPARLGTRALWRSPVPAAAIRRRLAEAHEPYHQAIAHALADAVARHGHAVLIDCHSMPPLTGARAARFVVGNRHGRSSRPAIAEATLRIAAEAGLRPALNAPYAGAYTLERHGRPAEGVEAIQIELDRTLYLDPALRTPSAGLAAMQRLVERVAKVAVAAARPSPMIAAE